MTKEQREAVDDIKIFVKSIRSDLAEESEDNQELADALDTVLSLIKAQQEEISKYKTLYERALSDVVKKDKMIDLMAKTISNNIVITYFNDAENVKRYYEKLVKTKSEQL